MCENIDKEGRAEFLEMPLHHEPGTIGQEFFFVFVERKLDGRY